LKKGTKKFFQMAYAANVELNRASQYIKDFWFLKKNRFLFLLPE